jgi:ornithine lipid ester-linked acyl 2-hydroxylase
MELEFTDKNPKLFYSVEDFPHLKILEDNYSVILNELNDLRKNSLNGYWLDTFPGYLNEKSENKWKVFTFKFFGIKHPVNCKLCPKTADLVLNKLDLVSCDFSYLPAKTHINPHKGFTKMVLRAHLGLIIPDDCGLRVGNETRKWEAGKLMIFDDSFDHEAWNNSTEDRFVLMFDIPNPKWGYTTDEINKYKIETIRDEFMLKLFSKEQWQHFYEVGEFDILS